MADIVSAEKRSRIMSAIRSSNTSPELKVRKALRALGIGYRLHVSKLPGRPDIVLRRYLTVIEIRGCFWHSHICLKGRRPTSNTSYWVTKLNRTKARDRRNLTLLRRMGWTVKVLWECQINKWGPDQLCRFASRALAIKPSASRH